MLNIGSNVIQPNPIVNITANNQVVPHSGGGIVIISSDSAILNSRIFSIANGTTDGQILVVLFTGANSAKLTGTDKHLFQNNSLFLVWSSISSSWNLVGTNVKNNKTGYDHLFFDEMLATLPIQGVSSTVTGTGASGNIAPQNVGNATYKAGREGFRASATGTTATGRHSYLTTQNTLFNFDTTPIIYEADHWLFTLPNALQDYILTSGFIDASTNATIVDGAFFRFSFASANWIAVTRNNSVETAVNTGITVANLAWSKLKIIGTSAGIEFYVNEALATTISTNIPTAGTRQFGAGYNFEKIVGTTSIAMDTDFFKVAKELNR